MKVEEVAMICHEANRTYCCLNNDFSNLPWEMTPQEIKDTTIKGVEFAIANPNITAKAMHHNWSVDKRSQGWVYGATKDVVNKKHPCLCVYSELSEFDRKKDVLFLAIVRALEGE